MVRLMLAVLALCVFAMPVSAEAKSRKSGSKSYSSSYSSGYKSSRSSRNASRSSRKADSSTKSFGSFGGTPAPAQPASPGAPATPSKAASFGSFGNAPKPAPSVSPGVATSALSGDLSKRAAHAAALNTLDQGNRRADMQSSASPNNTAPANTSSGYAPAYANANNPAAPQPASYNGGGGSDHSFLWYLLGRSSGEHDGDNHAAQAAQYSSTGNNAAYPSADKESSSSWGVWIIVTILLAGAVYFVYRRNKNQPAEGQTGNYTL